jgi:hypothetical protein
MAVRASMQFLIDYVRELINDTDTVGNTEYFTDQQIQDRLDQHRLDAYLLPLTPVETLETNGQITWHDFFMPHPYWETDVLIQKLTGVAATPDTSDYRVGKFHFITAVNETLVATGRCYNVYMACSKLCFQLEAQLRNQFNFTADGLTIQRITQVRDLHSQGVTFASMGWGGVGGGTQTKLVRKDMRG